ncbi:MAG TPA: 2-oxoacid:acceptor oxidoreductase family protein [Candidatus Paceibacterota bacterium]|nr:2-oxoacid:acceptor oxidoreductase family protein [Candidatus Paceibacterota bacterium]
MFQVRIHGRGGQGVVTAAELLAQAAFFEGRHAQAFPSFGSERTGAPVVAFARISETPIRVREPVMMPDAIIVQDETLFHVIDVLNGLSPTGVVVINTTHTLAELGLGEFASTKIRFVTVPAAQLAMEHLGKPVPNAVLLGAFAAFTNVVSLDAVTRAISARFSNKLATGNSSAATAAFEIVRSQLTLEHGEPAHA